MYTSAVRGGHPGARALIRSRHHLPAQAPRQYRPTERATRNPVRPTRPSTTTRSTDVVWHLLQTRLPQTHRLSATTGRALAEHSNETKRPPEVDEPTATAWAHEPPPHHPWVDKVGSRAAVCCRAGQHRLRKFPANRHLSIPPDIHRTVHDGHSVC